MTVAPSSANRSTTPRPIPRDAPVTSATFPSSLICPPGDVLPNPSGRQILRYYHHTSTILEEGIDLPPATSVSFLAQSELSTAAGPIHLRRKVSTSGDLQIRQSPSFLRVTGVSSSR